MFKYPSVISLKMLQDLEIPKGGIVGAAGKVANTNNGKSINVGEQHIHFENPPENTEDFMVMAFG